MPPELSKDAETWRLDKIKELKEKKELNEFEESFLEFLKKNTIQEHLREIFFEINSIIEYYMDDTSDNIMLYSLWLMGTYFHDQFISYPYLFLNAMRGSGKSRLLKLLSYLGDGKYTSSVTEPLIFRTSGLLCIDEIERIGSKDKTALRELLNASYKKGMSIIRMRKKKTMDGERQVPEEFECYRPIAMANIWGMDEILGDRCITRVLEKSNDPIKTKRLEQFEGNPKLESLRVKLVQCRVCSVELKKKLYLWNHFIDTLHLYTHNTNYTNYTNYTFSEEEITFYTKINDSGIYGRNLELFFPIFILANVVGNDIFDVVLDVAKRIDLEKKQTESQESADVLVYSFIARQENDLNFISMKQLYNEFKNFSDLDLDWITAQWFGKALKRLNLIVDKRRLAAGIEIIPNVLKSQEKLKMFKKEENDNKL